MIEEINESLEGFGAAIALFLVTSQKTLSYFTHFSFERRVRSGALYAAS